VLVVLENHILLQFLVVIQASPLAALLQALQLQQQHIQLQLELVDQQVQVLVLVDHKWFKFSIFSTITSAGGGGGVQRSVSPRDALAIAGGSGGGGAQVLHLVHQAILLQQILLKDNPGGCTGAWG
jgi:hypothetical protein